MSSEARRRALWGRFITSYWTRRPDFVGLLYLDSDLDTSPDHLLRLGQAKLVVAERDGAITDALAAALAVEPLLTYVEDPFVRSGFLNNLAHALTLAATDADAEDVAQHQIEEANRFRLTFALPSALINLAAAQLGRRSVRDGNHSGKNSEPEGGERFCLPRQTRRSLRLHLVGTR